MTHGQVTWLVIDAFVTELLTMCRGMGDDESMGMNGGARVGYAERGPELEGDIRNDIGGMAASTGAVVAMRASMDHGG
eukprot:12969-Prorocentrum_minimum.AAC.1